MGRGQGSTRKHTRSKPIWPLTLSAKSQRNHFQLLSCTIANLHSISAQRVRLEWEAVEQLADHFSLGQINLQPPPSHRTLCYRRHFKIHRSVRALEQASWWKVFFCCENKPDSKHTKVSSFVIIYGSKQLEQNESASSFFVERRQPVLHFWHYVNIFMEICGNSALFFQLPCHVTQCLQIHTKYYYTIDNKD